MAYGDASKELRDKRREQGLCTRCGKRPLAMNKYGTKLSDRCEDCGNQHRLSQMRSFEKNKGKPKKKREVHVKQPDAEPSKPLKFERPPPGLSLKEIEDFYLKPPPKRDEPTAQFINAIERTGFDDDMQNRYGEIRKGLY